MSDFVGRYQSAATPQAGDGCAVAGPGARLRSLADAALAGRYRRVLVAIRNAGARPWHTRSVKRQRQLAFALFCEFCRRGQRRRALVIERQVRQDAGGPLWWLRTDQDAATAADSGSSDV